MWSRSMPGAVLIALSALTPVAFAQSYPSKPWRLILPDGTGGPADMRARQMARG